MFKKLRKRRLSLNFKRNSSSLKNINVVETFVHQTAKIMSASAENLNEENESSHLVTLLDQSFQSNSKCSTAPASNISSPQYHIRSQQYSKQSKSSNTDSKIEREVPENHFKAPRNEPSYQNSPDNEIIFEENNNLSEIKRHTPCNVSIRKTCQKSHILDSPQKIIEKQPFKRSHSFNDINIKSMSSLNKKNGSIQTFISTNATLSMEFENKSDQMHNKMLSDELLIDKEEYESDNLANEEVDEKICYSKVLKKIVRHPLFLTGVLVTGVMIIVPTISKFSDWFTDVIKRFSRVDSFPGLKPLGPECLFTRSITPLDQLQKGIVINETTTNKLNSYIPKIFQKFVQRSSLISGNSRHS